MKPHKTTHLGFAVGLLSALLLLSAAPAASAQSVEVSGNVFHKKVCAAPIASGRMRCLAHVVTDVRGNILAQIGAQSAASGGAPAGYGANDLRAAYAITKTGSRSTVIAIVDAFGYTNAESDMRTYRAKYRLPVCSSANGCFAKYNQNGQKGNYPAQDLGWAQETAVDLDMASAMCPNCKIILVEATTNAASDLAAATNVAAALGAHVIANSYGGDELQSTGLEAAYNHPGVAITAASGDSGFGAEFPATSPHVVAVGGTSLFRGGGSRGWTETVWSGTGSGCSMVYAKPAWQTDALCTMRMTNDVAAVADPSTGVAVFGPPSLGSSGWMVFGGTSVSTQIIGGIYGVNGGAVNYGSNPYKNLGALNDVTSGNNGPCAGIYFCTAGPGYDGPTGLGTPKGFAAF